MPWLASTGPTILVAPLFVVCFLLLSAALGRRILRWLGAVDQEIHAERAVIALGLGAGALQFVPFLLGAAGVLSLVTLRAALGLVTLALLSDLRAVLARFRELWKRRERPDTWWMLWIVSLVPAVLIAGLFALTPSIDADGLSYHLAVPKRWLESGALVYLPTYPYSNTPMGIEMLFMIALAFVGDVGAKLLHLALGLGGAVGLYLVGRRLENRAAGVAATTLYLVGPAGVALVLGWAYLEGVIALALIAASLAWLRWYRDRGDGWLRASALLAGISVSFKITALLFAIGLAALTVLAFFDEARKRGAPRLRDLGPAWRLVPFAVLPVIPWFTRSALVTGNPFFPLLTSLIPTRDYSHEIASTFAHYNRYFLWGSGRLAHWGVERRQLVLGAVGLGMSAVAGVVFFRVRSWLGRATTLVALAVALVQLSAAGLYTRYWMPLVSLLALLILAPFVKPVKAAWLKAVLLAIAAYASVQRARGSLGNVQNDVAGLGLTAVGARAERDFVLGHLPLYPLYERVNRDLPRDSVVLLSYYCGGGFYIDRRTACTEFLQDSLRFTSFAAFASDVEELGVTHVLAPRTLAEGGARPAIDPAAPVTFRNNQDEFMGRLLKSRGRLLSSASDQGLYALDGPRARGDAH